MQVTDQHKQLLDKAKIGLMSMQDTAFFTTILFSMKFVWDDTQPTAYVNGVRLGFNPDFFMTLSADEKVFVLVHECCHVAYDHIGRGVSMDRQVFNQAADHVINLMLKARGFKMPDWVLKDERFIGMSTEQVYTILLTEQQAGMPMPGTGMEDIREPENMDEKAVKHMIDEIIVRASTISKMQNDKPGTVPGEIELYLKKLLNPKLPWQAILRKYLTEIAKSDYTWTKPNRRYFPGHYLPSLHGDGGLTNFQAWVDISGSETDEDFLRFISELHGVLRMMKPKKITLGQFDTRIHSIDVVRNVMDLAAVKFHGRGGTRITDVLDHIEKTKPKLALIFSDGGFDHDRETCNSNVIWMIHDNPDWAAPFGRVIHYNTHGQQ